VRKAARFATPLGVNAACRNVTADLNDVEAIDIAALRGADVIVVEDVSSTDLVEVNVARHARRHG
jgi:hypothetical protein